MRTRLPSALPRLMSPETRVQASNMTESLASIAVSGTQVHSVNISRQEEGKERGVAGEEEVNNKHIDKLS